VCRFLVAFVSGALPLFQFWGFFFGSFFFPLFFFVRGVWGGVSPFLFDGSFHFLFLPFYKFFLFSFFGFRVLVCRGARVVGFSFQNPLFSAVFFFLWNCCA